MRHELPWARLFGKSPQVRIQASGTLLSPAFSCKHTKSVIGRGFGLPASCLGSSLDDRSGRFHKLGQDLVAFQIGQRAQLRRLEYRCKCSDCCKRRNMSNTGLLQGRVLCQGEQAETACTLRTLLSTHSSNAPHLAVLWGKMHRRRVNRASIGGYFVAEPLSSARHRSDTLTLKKTRQLPLNTAGPWLQQQLFALFCRLPLKPW